MPSESDTTRAAHQTALLFMRLCTLVRKSRSTSSRSSNFSSLLTFPFVPLRHITFPGLYVLLGSLLFSSLHLTSSFFSIYICCFSTPPHPISSCFFSFLPFSLPPSWPRSLSPPGAPPCRRASGCRSSLPLVSALCPTCLSGPGRLQARLSGSTAIVTWLLCTSSPAMD